MDSNPPPFELTVNDQVLLVRAGGDAVEETEATVQCLDENEVTLDADPRIVFVKPGALMKFRPEKDQGLVAFGKVKAAQREDGKLKLVLESLRWERDSSGRAERRSSSYRAIATFVDPDSESKETKRTTGTAVNVSLTGVRMKVRTPIPKGSLVHLQIFLNAELSINVLAKTARIVGGSEAHGGGFEIGMSFVRFLDGYDEFVTEIGVVPIDDVADEERAA